MKAIIIDDEELSRITLKTLLRDYCSNVQLIGEAPNAEVGKQLIDALRPDLVFLDIAMPGQNGLDMLRDLGRVDFKTIFVTAHQEYALQAIRLSAIDYLLKPVDEDELIAAVNKIELETSAVEKQMRMNTLIDNLRGSSPSDMKICISDFEGYHIRKVGDILFCEADNTYTKIHMTNGETLIVSKTLSVYDDLLSHSGFLRVHKSYLINIQHLRSYQKGDGGYVVLDNGSKVDVSKRKKDQLLELLRKM